MISILKEVRVATFLMLSVFSVLGFAQETRRFEVYQSMGFDTLPTAVMDKHGIKQLTLYGHGHLWVKKDPFLPEPNFAEIKNRASASKKNNDTLVSLDIEMWEFDPKVTSKNKKTIDRFVNVAKTFRQQSPDVRFGFYSQLPLRNYWDPIRNSKKLASGQPLNAAHRGPGGCHHAIPIYLLQRPRRLADICRGKHQGSAQVRQACIYLSLATVHAGYGREARASRIHRPRFLEAAARDRI
jgi:hypothetical protein